MDFDRALNKAIDRASWNVDHALDQGDLIVRDISQSRGMQVKINARRPEVVSTWDKWDENKQNRGQETLVTYLSNALRRVMPGMAIFLSPDSWTPDA